MVQPVSNGRTGTRGIRTADVLALLPAAQTAKPPAKRQVKPTVLGPIEKASELRDPFPQGATSMKRRRRRQSPGYWVRRSKNLGGRRARVFNDNEALILLKAAIEGEGSQAAFADRIGIHRSYISTVLNGRAPVTEAITKALGLFKVYVVK